jgi:hypothetical protein
MIQRKLYHELEYTADMLLSTLPYVEIESEVFPNYFPTYSHINPFRSTVAEALFRYASMDEL